MVTQSSSHAPTDISVMISYSRTDAAFAQKLCGDLKQAGFPTWLDTSSILGGRLWRDEIDRAIDEAQVVLVVMSPAAMQSKWVRREYTYAARQGKVIIPLDYYPCDIPALLADRQLVSFRPGFVNTETFYTRQLQQLIAALAGSAALGSPAPLAAATPSSRAASQRHLGAGALALMFLASFVLAALAGYANGALLPVALQPYASRVFLGGIALGVLSLLSLLLLRARRPAGSVNLYLDDRVRFLTKVHTRYTNRLKPPFAGAVQITLGLSEAAQAVAHPALARQEGPAGLLRSFPAGTTITTAFEEAEEQLLILGAPGAGKSWLLYALALNLVERARADRASVLPVPVVFDLASWAQHQRPLAEWMVSQLTDTWQVPPTIARVWVDRQQFFPLLDGLDEVRQDAQDACVEAINRYQRDHGLIQLAVCCRKADYDALKTRLDLRTAVVAEPLTAAQIDIYLEAGAAPLAGLRRLIREDTQLQDLLSTPLMLNVVSLAYAGKDAAVVPLPTEDENGRNVWTQAVFRDYVPTMLARRFDSDTLAGRSNDIAYSVTDTTRYLVWLAAKMRAHKQIDMFYLEQLQSSWLPDATSQRHWKSTVRLVFGLVFGLLGGLVFGLVFGLLGGLVHGLVHGLVFGLLGGLVFGLGFGLLSGGLMMSIDADGTISLISTVRWRTPTVQDWSIELLFGLLFGLAFGLLSGLRFGLGFGLVGGLVFGLFIRLLIGLRASAVDSRDLQTPNEGLRDSLRIGLSGVLLGGVVVGLVGGLVGGLGFGLVGGLGFGLAFGLVFGLSVGLSFGLQAYVEHQMLRRTLVRLRLIPRDYVAFLDFATAHILLQRVGGGYRFVHALLLDYFADQWPALSATERPNE